MRWPAPLTSDERDERSDSSAAASGKLVQPFPGSCARAADDCRGDREVLSAAADSAHGVAGTAAPAYFLLRADAARPDRFPALRRVCRAGGRFAVTGDATDRDVRDYEDAGGVFCGI